MASLISDAERRSLMWLAGFEAHTVENVAAVITPRPADSKGPAVAWNHLLTGVLDQQHTEHGLPGLQQLRAKWTITVAVPAAHTSGQGLMTTDVYPTAYRSTSRPRMTPRTTLTSGRVMTQ